MEEDNDLFDVVSSKEVIPPEDVDILDVNPGCICRVSYMGSYYKAKIMERGLSTNLKAKLKELIKRSDVSSHALT